MSRDAQHTIIKQKWERCGGRYNVVHTAERSSARALLPRLHHNVDKATQLPPSLQHLNQDDQNILPRAGAAVLLVTRFSTLDAIALIASIMWNAPKNNRLLKDVLARFGALQIGQIGKIIFVFTFVTGTFYNTIDTNDDNTQIYVRYNFLERVVSTKRLKTKS